MAERQQETQQSFLVPGDGALIGLVMREDGRDATRYFSDEAAADAAVSGEGTDKAVDLIGAWSDLDWEEMASSLDRIRHESIPSPAIEV